MKSLTSSAHSESNKNLRKAEPPALLSLQLTVCPPLFQLWQWLSVAPEPPRTAKAAAATWGSAGLCRAGCTDSELPLEKDSDREGAGGSAPLPVCLDWASGELWLVFLNLSSTCSGELEDTLHVSRERETSGQKQDEQEESVSFSFETELTGQWRRGAGLRFGTGFFKTMKTKIKQSSF